MNRFVIVIFFFFLILLGCDGGVKEVLRQNSEVNNTSLSDYYNGFFTLRLGNDYISVLDQNSHLRILSKSDAGEYSYTYDMYNFYEFRSITGLEYVFTKLYRADKNLGNFVYYGVGKQVGEVSPSNYCPDGSTNRHILESEYTFFKALAIDETYTLNPNCVVIKDIPLNNKSTKFQDYNLDGESGKLEGRRVFVSPVENNINLGIMAFTEDSVIAEDSDFFYVEDQEIEFPLYITPEGKIRIVLNDFYSSTELDRMPDGNVNKAGRKYVGLDALDTYGDVSGNFVDREYFSVVTRTTGENGQIVRGSGVVSVDYTNYKIDFIPSDKVSKFDFGVFSVLNLNSLDSTNEKLYFGLQDNKLGYYGNFEKAANYNLDGKFKFNPSSSKLDFNYIDSFNAYKDFFLYVGDNFFTLFGITQKNEITYFGYDYFDPTDSKKRSDFVKTATDNHAFINFEKDDNVEYNFYDIKASKVGVFLLSNNNDVYELLKEDNKYILKKYNYLSEQ